MKTVNDHACSADELAGHWTEPALRLLSGAGIRPISVDLEVETWRTLEIVLRAELGARRSFRLSTAASLNRLKGQVIRKAAGLIARKFGFPLAFNLPVTSDECGICLSLATHHTPLRAL